MPRRLFNFLTATSLIICLVSIGLLVRGHWARDYITWARRDGHFVSIDLSRECIALSIVHSSASRQVKWRVISPDAIPYPRTRIMDRGRRYRDLFVVLVDSS